MSIISEYEELLKVKNFSEQRKENPKMQTPFECTYERLKYDLKTQYSENIDEKISRWINITKAHYFKDVVPVRYYIQGKMLYRDGFYEAAISIAKSICEMICYELLSEIPHPFNDLKTPDKHSPNFSVLKRFLLMPKMIEKKKFENDILGRIVDKTLQKENSNFIKLAYQYDKVNAVYKLKLETAKRESNLIRFFKIFEEVNFKSFEVFKPEVLTALEKTWIEGSAYVHAKHSVNDAEKDAFLIIDSIGFVLNDLYGAEAIVQSEIVSGYSFFPDICSELTFGIDFFATPENAQTGYYNLPSAEDFNRMINICGLWEGEWGINGVTNKGKFHFYRKGEYINCKLEVENLEPSSINMGISFFGNYFFINSIKGDREKYYFEFSFLNDQVLIGKHKISNELALFKKVK